MRAWGWGYANCKGLWELHSRFASHRSVVERTWSNNGGDGKPCAEPVEATGVYWIPLFEELEREGFECLLISSRSLRRVAGRKSDITDAQWIQTLHTYGLLESSFRPQAELIALRTLLRHRSQLVEHRSPHIQHMQKALLQMNVQLTQAVTDITGITGQTIIWAILAGERDPQKLAGLREPGCKPVLDGQSREE